MTSEAGLDSCVSWSCCGGARRRRHAGSRKAGRASAARTDPGISTSTRLPTEFGPDTNVVWKTELPFGHSSPALTRERIFLTAARGDRLVTICLDRRTGRILWERDAPRPRVEKLDSRNGPGRADAGDRRHQRLRVLRRFRADLLRHGRPRTLAAAARPVQQPVRHGRVAGAGRRLVVLPCDQNTDSFIVAVGQRDGRVRWKTPRPEAHSGHSTPILYTPAGGATQIIVPGSFLLTAYAARQRREALVGRRPVVRAEVDAGRQRRHAVHQRLRHAAEPAGRAPAITRLRRHREAVRATPRAR